MDDLGTIELSSFSGLGRVSAIAQGQTLILIYINNLDNGEDVGEQIELEECKKDVHPEIENRIVIADFWIPVKYSCCQKDDKIFELISPR